jgi:hypothetical protein
MASSFLGWKKDIKTMYVCQLTNTYLKLFSSYLLKVVIPVTFWKVKVGKEKIMPIHRLVRGALLFCAGDDRPENRYL